MDTGTISNNHKNSHTNTQINSKDALCRDMLALGSFGRLSADCIQYITGWWVEGHTKEYLHVGEAVTARECKCENNHELA
jgi:hypothetical protein